MFPADRRLLLDGLGEIKKDDIVIFDRYVPSAIAYRMADGIDREWVQGINKNFPRYDLGFYIDITPEESIRRNTDQKFNIRYSYEHLDRVRKELAQSGINVRLWFLRGNENDRFRKNSKRNISK